MLQTKVVLNEISYKKLSGQISLSTLEVELKASTDLPFLKYYNAQEWECIFTLGQTCQKILIISKNSSNKSCEKLNFLLKIQKKHIFIYLTGGAGLQKFAVFEVL